MALEDGQERQPEMETDLLPEDRTLWWALAGRLAQPGRPGLNLGEETVEALEQACPALEIDHGLRLRLDRLLERAAGDLEFETVMRQRRRPVSLGSYLAFLRGKAGLSVTEAARRYRLDFQLLTELEGDRVQPGRIPARPLALLIRRLKGSLELTESLLAATVQAPRYLATGARGSLYRTAPGASQADAEAASLAARGEAGRRVENPEYREEVETVRRLIGEVREAWRTR
jgi:hypothetical protein